MATPDKKEPPDLGQDMSHWGASLTELGVMTLEHKMWLLDMVDELVLHSRVAKIKANTVDQEWRILDHLVSDELLYREAKAEAELAESVSKEARNPEGEFPPEAPENKTEDSSA